MRKTILGHDYQPVTSSTSGWFGNEAIVETAVSSEAEDTPVENVLNPEREAGWRAGTPAQQIIRITFSAPTKIRCVQLVFRDCTLPERKNLRCAVALEGRGEVIRQQWTFSPWGSTEEVEDSRMTLDDIVVLELAIIPMSTMVARMPHYFACASVRAITIQGRLNMATIRLVTEISKHVDVGP